MNNPNEIFIIFTSKYSESCKQFNDAISHIFPYFNTKIIDIDNPIIRKSIMNASVNKITSVPALMLFMPQRNEIKIFEKEQAVEKINQAVEAVNDYILQQEQKKIQEQQAKAKEIERQYPTDTFQQPSKERFASEGDVSSLDDVLGDEEDIPQPPKKNPRRKIQKGVYASNEYSPIDEEAQMLTSLKPLPPKGEGHTGMARTSLPEFNVGDEDVVRSASDRMMGPDFENSEAAVMPPSALKNSKKVKVKTGKRVQIVEDLSESLEEENFGRRPSRIRDDDGFGNYDEPPKPSGMSLEDIMGPNGVGNIPMESKETSMKSSAVKNAAEALMRQRQQQEANIPQNMR
jgi:hypothetical protein